MPGAYGSPYQVLKDAKTSGIPILFISAHHTISSEHLNDPKTRFVQNPFRFPRSML